jgi:hypothetical protein
MALMRGKRYLAKVGQSESAPRQGWDLEAAWQRWLRYKTKLETEFRRADPKPLDGLRVKRENTSHN